MGADAGVDDLWPGRFGRFIRPIGEAEMRRAVIIISAMFGAGSVAVLPVTLNLLEVAEIKRPLLWVVVVTCLMISSAMAALGRSDSATFRRRAPSVTVVAVLLTIVGVNAGIYAAGPRLGVAAAYLVDMPLIVFFVLRLRWAVAATSATLVAYGIALVFLEGVAAPVQHWLIVVTTAGLTGWMIGSIAARLDIARAGEATAKAGLSRFLSPQVADVVTSEGAAELLAPHRADIAVFFVDLRGFTAFTNTVSAERVMQVLDEYYSAVGSILDRHSATIGGFDGDGVFAYLGDPIPHATAAATSVAMAREIAVRLDELTAAWSTTGAAIGYGIGLTYGEATLGRVGYEGRLDYTPVGACVNLAARLCADAKHGEIVIDDAIRKAAKQRAGLRRRADVNLKGFGATKTYAVSH